ncbi:TetR/AcrR family transcriptional regulator [uncultured Lacinutrix sp.]|uniref:TetR/AcrR family transcriptional regulator n=1 Tax=uncultured Lacinutrix sp. TaxID=574032 RepID=UPI00260DFA89|nr:TetR/AcrR family transcriptional regulator [uncultured Lacinutrix sp.]
MKQLPINITIDSDLYLKNPESTDLGKKIVSKSIEMINTLGFEGFTFKKLGVAIGSNESSIYRYFESKHSLLVYLISWYWSWIEYKIVFTIMNIDDAEERLKRCIMLLTEDISEDNSISFINEILLHQIIIAESSKAYHTKDIDKENEKGYYKTYKRVVQRVSDIVLEINTTFEFPHMLVSTVIEGAHHQRYFSKHLPALTDVEDGKNNIVRFYTDLVFKTIK